MPLHLEIITGERVVYSDEVDAVTAPGALGQITILPRHTSLLTLLEPGEMRLRKGREEIVLAVHGGFLEVHHDRVIVLADAAERAEEIDVARAQAAMERARALLAQKGPAVDLARAEAALRRSQVRLRVARRARPVGAPPPTGG